MLALVPAALNSFSGAPVRVAIPVRSRPFMLDVGAADAEIAALKAQLQIIQLKAQLAELDAPSKPAAAAPPAAVMQAPAVAPVSAAAPEPLINSLNSFSAFPSFA